LTGILTGNTDEPQGVSPERIKFTKTAGRLGSYKARRLESLRTENLKPCKHPSFQAFQLPGFPASILLHENKKDTRTWHC